ncbi:replicative DNA helicase [Symmachiella dynata]|uniref:AAA family ATPase n=1 Tax=Symmachiella dynata TaxID=2527995 RepID=UPI00118CC58C|nr:AAA family ATPase [Symmachiella dynata]QDT48193.1 replicative DNA helicase [Symmachiella dynata]
MQRGARSLVGQQADAELHLIGCLLLNEQRIDTVRNLVGSSDFASSTCEAIYRTACQLRAEGRPVNPLAIGAALGQQQCSELNIATTIAEAIDAVPHDTHTEYYAGLVREYGTRRALQSKLLDQAGQIADCSQPLDPAKLNFEDYATFRLNSAAAGLKTKTLGSVEPTETAWLWPGRIPLGSLTLFSGEPGIGKTFSAADFAARVAMGWSWPDGTPGGEPRDIVFLSAEDNEETLSRRFEMLGCDRERIHILDSGIEEFIDGKFHDRFLNLQTDIGHLEDLFERVPAAGLLILDTAADFMGNANQNRNDEVRAVYTPLARLAKRQNIAVLLLAHFNKNTATTQAIYRGMGSLAFVALARVSWGLFRDPEQKQRILFAQVKNNLGPPQPALAFEIVEPGLPAWEPDPVEVDSDQLLAERKPAPATKTQRSRAKEWLTEQLAQHPVSAMTLRERAEEVNISWRTIERASHDLQVHKYKFGAGQEQAWMWALDELRSF